MGAAAAVSQSHALRRHKTRLAGSAFLLTLHSYNPAPLNGGCFPRCSFYDRLRGLLPLRTDDARVQSVRIVVYTVREDCIEDADQLAAYRHNDLLLSGFF